MSVTNVKWLKKISENVIKRIPDGESIQVQSLWKEQTTVIYFLRRFGCPYCHYLARQLCKIKPLLDKNDVKLVGIGPEELGSKEFYEAKHFDGELFYDPEKKSFKDLEYKRYNVFNMLGAVLSARSRKIANLASAEGLKGNLSGDLMQTGGILIVKKGGKEIILNYKQEGAAHQIENQEVLDILGIKDEVEQSEDSPGPSSTAEAGSI